MLLADASASDKKQPNPYNRGQRMNLARGARIGSYEIVGLIGAGGMGEVYRAHVIPSSDATLPSRSCRACLPATPIGRRASSAKRGCSPPSITQTSGLSMASKTPTAFRALVLELIDEAPTALSPWPLHPGTTSPSWSPDGKLIVDVAEIGAVRRAVHSESRLGRLDTNHESFQPIV